MPPTPPRRLRSSVGFGKKEYTTGCASSFPFQIRPPILRNQRRSSRNVSPSWRRQRFFPPRSSRWCLMMARGGCRASSADGQAACSDIGCKWCVAGW